MGTGQAGAGSGLCWAASAAIKSAHVDRDGRRLAAADVENGEIGGWSSLENGSRELIEVGDEPAIDADQGVTQLDARLAGRTLRHDVDDLENEAAAHLNLLGPQAQTVEDRPAGGRRGWPTRRGGCNLGRGLRIVLAAVNDRSTLV